MTPKRMKMAQKSTKENMQKFIFFWSLGKCLKWLQMGRKLFPTNPNPANMF